MFTCIRTLFIVQQKVCSQEWDLLFTHGLLTFSNIRGCAKRTDTIQLDIKKKLKPGKHGQHFEASSLGKSSPPECHTIMCTSPIQTASKLLLVKP